MLSILLIGPNYPKSNLTKKMQIAKHLAKYNIKPMLLESEKDISSDITIIQKFERLLKNEPDYVVAIFPKNSLSDSVNFELGYIGAKYKLLDNKLLILVEKNTNVKEISHYLREGLFPQVIVNQYSTVREMVDHIRRFVLTHD